MLSLGCRSSGYGRACFRFFEHDALWAYAFVPVPLLVAALQCLRNARVRFCATFALWIPFLLFLALLTSVAAYCSMRYEDPSESTGHRMGRRP